MYVCDRRRAETGLRISESFETSFTKSAEQRALWACSPRRHEPALDRANQTKVRGELRKPNIKSPVMNQPVPKSLALTSRTGAGPLSLINSATLVSFVSGGFSGDPAAHVSAVCRFARLCNSE